MSNDLDCSATCYTFFKILNSCPTKHINFYSPTRGDFYEVAMVFLSMAPYPVSFLVLLATTYYKTTRSALILIMIFLQNFIVEFIKNNLKDPRPNYICNQQYGNPSNHATFFSCFITWFAMEYCILESKYRCRDNLLKLGLILLFPLVMFARIYLKYHSIEQISNGIVLGIFVGVTWFIVSDSLILKSDNPFRRVFERLQLRNNMSEYRLNSFEGYDPISESENVNQQYYELLKKNRQLTRLKEELHNITANLKNIDFIKEAEAKFANAQESGEEKKHQ